MTITKERLEFFHEGALEAYEAVLHVIGKDASIEVLKGFINLQMSALTQHKEIKVPSDNLLNHLKEF